MFSIKLIKKLIILSFICAKSLATSEITQEENDCLIRVQETIKEAFVENDYTKLLQAKGCYDLLSEEYLFKSQLIFSTDQWYGQTYKDYVGAELFFPKDFDNLLDSKHFKRHDQEVFRTPVYLWSLVICCKYKNPYAGYHLSQILIQEWVNNRKELNAPNFYEELYKESINAFLVSQNKQSHFCLGFDAYFVPEQCGYSLLQDTYYGYSFKQAQDNFNFLSGSRGAFYLLEMKRLSAHSFCDTYESLQQAIKQYQELGTNGYYPGVALADYLKDFSARKFLNKSSTLNTLQPVRSYHYVDFENLWEQFKLFLTFN